MDERMEGVYFGIDISDKYTMISFYQLHMDEPDTISTVMGSEVYQIPTILAKKKGLGQWFFGEEAKRQEKMNHAVGVDQLLSKALTNQQVFLEGESYGARELMVIYIKRLLSIPGHFYANAPLEKLVITVENISMELTELFTMVAGRLGLESDQIMMIDHRESFYYYALNQDPQIFLHDVALFDYTKKTLQHCILERNLNTRPQVIQMLQGNHGSLIEERDREFEEVITRTFAGKIISSVYLIGDGFDGDWMKLSLNKLCKGRRVFLGKNLYSKGACYAGVVKDEKIDWPFVYMGDNELKLNLSIKVINQNEMQFFTLITAGESWYESKGECEAILDGTPEIEFWIQKPDSREAKVEVLELTDLPMRENRTTRLRIEAKPLSDTEIMVVLKDLGFGEIIPSSGQTWEHIMHV